MLPSLVLYAQRLRHSEFASASARSGLVVYVGHTLLTCNLVQL